MIMLSCSPAAAAVAAVCVGVHCSEQSIARCLVLLVDCPATQLYAPFNLGCAAAAALPGYEGGLTPELAAALKVTRYQSSKASLAYADYLRWAADATTAEEEGAVPVSPTRETVTVLA